MKSKRRAPFWLLALLMVAAAVTAKAQEPDTATIVVQVASDTGGVVEGAKVSAFAWKGFWEATGNEATTGPSGSAKLRSIPAEGYMTVMVEAKGFATVCQDMELGGGEERSVTFKLAKPKRGTIRVVDPDGNPISGVVLSELSFRDDYGNAYFHRHGSEMLFSPEPTASDVNGVIILPEIATSSVVNIMTFHEDYVAARLENMVASDGEMGVVTLTRGVPVKIQLVPGEGLDRVPDDLAITMSLYPRGEDRTRINRIYHQTNPTDGTIKANFTAAEYESLIVSTRDPKYTITPRLNFHSQAFGHLLDIRDSGEPKTIEFSIRKNVTVRGKLVGDRSVPAGSRIATQIENLHPSIEGSTKLDQFTGGPSAGIDEEGYYELLLPPGQATIYPQLDGFTMEPDGLEITIVDGVEQNLPDITVTKIGKLKGIVVDEDGQPIAGCVVRGCRGTSAGEYLQTDERGFFELIPDRFLAFEKPGATIVAFDPKSDRATVMQVPNDRKDDKILTVSCLPRETGWLIDQIERQQQQIQSEAAADGPSAEDRQTRIDKSKAMLADQTPPDLSEGTWLNSRVASLKDFRDKHVLLDFWFIGCGPCKQDLPTVQLAQRLFGGDKFSVVSVHITAQSVQNVASYAKANEMDFPIVVDNAQGDLDAGYKELGVRFYPCYLLLDPDGKVITSDAFITGPSLRNFKVERIWELVR